MTDRRVRLADVAREAGVSVGAASNALTGKNRIPEQTRARVREAADRLGYVPDTVARALRTGRSDVIGLLVNPLERPRAFDTERTNPNAADTYRTFWGTAVGLLAASANDRGYGLLVLPSLDQLPKVPLAGLVLLDADTSVVEHAFRLQIPVASPNAPGDPRLAVDVVVDDAGMAEDALRHLVDRGCRRPALVWPDVATRWSIDAIDAHEGWCARSGVEPIRESQTLQVSDVAPTVDRLLAAGVDGVVTIAPWAEALSAELGRRASAGAPEVLLVARSLGAETSLAAAGISSLALQFSDKLDAIVGSLIDVAEGRVPGPIRMRARFSLTARASTLGRDRPTVSG